MSQWFFGQGFFDKKTCKEKLKSLFGIVLNLLPLRNYYHFISFSFL